MIRCTWCVTIFRWQKVTAWLTRKNLTISQCNFISGSFWGGIVQYREQYLPLSRDAQSTYTLPVTQCMLKMHLNAVMSQVEQSGPRRLEHLGDMLCIIRSCVIMSPVWISTEKHHSYHLVNPSQCYPRFIMNQICIYTSHVTSKVSNVVIVSALHCRAMSNALLTKTVLCLTLVNDNKWSTNHNSVKHVHHCNSCKSQTMVSV